MGTWSFGTNRSTCVEAFFHPGSCSNVLVLFTRARSWMGDRVSGGNNMEHRRLGLIEKTTPAPLQWPHSNWVVHTPRKFRWCRRQHGSRVFPSTIDTRIFAKDIVRRDVCGPASVYQRSRFQLWWPIPADSFVAMSTWIAPVAWQSSSVAVGVLSVSLPTCEGASRSVHKISGNVPLRVGRGEGLQGRPLGFHRGRGVLTPSPPPTSLP